jgi:hypothetical protein
MKLPSLGSFAPARREALRSFVAPPREWGVGKSTVSKPAFAIVPFEFREGSTGGEARVSEENESRIPRLPKRAKRRASRLPDSRSFRITTPGFR